MVDTTTLIDLKALLIEREECNAGTVQRLRDGLAQGKTQYRTLREVAEALKKKTEAGGPQAKNWHLKLGIASFFLGHLGDAVEHLKKAEGALASFYLGKALLERQEYDEALKAFEKAEKAGYTATQVQLQKAGILSAARRNPAGPGHPGQARGPGQPQRRVSLPARQLLPHGRQSAPGPQAPGKGRRTRSEPHRRALPARPRQRPGRQRRRGRSAFTNAA